MNNNDHLHTEPAQPRLSSAAHATTTVPPRPRSSFADFDADQLAQIAAWLDQHTYDQVIPLIQEEFGRTISRTALFRFYSSIAPTKFMVDTSQTGEAAAQILAFAATGEANFTEATVRVLEQTAFELAATSNRQPADFQVLKRLTQIICRHRNTAVRERLASVQQVKCDLRQQELDLKKEIALSRPKPVPPSNAQSPMLKAAPPSPQSSIYNLQSSIPASLCCQTPILT